MSPPLPDPIESELVRLLDGPDDDFWPGVARLCQQHPERSKDIQREAERLQARAEGTRPTGSTQAKPPPFVATAPKVFAEMHESLEQILVETSVRLHRKAIQENGIAAGRVEAGVEVLLRQLAVRFGVADDETARRVHAATLDEVERWAIAILSAPTLAAVFATGWTWATRPHGLPSSDHHLTGQAQRAALHSRCSLLVKLDASRRWSGPTCRRGCVAPS